MGQGGEANGAEDRAVRRAADRAARGTPGGTAVDRTRGLGGAHGGESDGVAVDSENGRAAQRTVRRGDRAAHATDDADDDEDPAARRTWRRAGRRGRLGGEANGAKDRAARRMTKTGLRG